MLQLERDATDPDGEAATADHDYGDAYLLPVVRVEIVPPHAQGGSMAGAGVLLLHRASSGQETSPMRW